LRLRFPYIDRLGLSKQVRCIHIHSAFALRLYVQHQIFRSPQSKVKLVGFTIDEDPFSIILNTETDGAGNYLESEGKDDRIVSKI
jgi:hypothetical protein